MKPSVLVTIVGVIAVGGFGLLMWGGSQGPASPADPGDAAQVSAGRIVYEAHCASCHGANLEGQPNWKERLADGKLPAPPHDATGHTWHHPDQQLFEITKRGVAAIVADYQSDMIGFGDRLSDRDIWNVIAYIRSTWPVEIQARQAEVTKRAAAGQGN
jgi:mono/diheme cytochrome c family protein